MAKVVLGEGVFYVDAYYSGDQFTIPYKVQYDDSSLTLELDFYPSRDGVNDGIVTRGSVELSPLYNGRRPSGIGASAPYDFSCGTYYSNGSPAWGFTGWAWDGAYKRNNNTIDFKVEIDGSMGANVADGFSISWDVPNKPPKCESISASNVYAGATATVRWSISDPDKDTTYTTSLKRYIKAKGSSTWVSSNLSVSSYTSSYSDAIPAEYRGGEVYWEVGFRDSYYATGTATSPTYTISVPNSAPTTPGVPAVPDKIKEGDTISVSWGASSDADGNLAGYQLQASLDNGSWTTVYTGTSTAIAYTVPKGTKYIAFRVCAYDSSNAYSGYATTATFEVVSALSGYISVNQIQRNIVGGYAFVDGVAREIVGAYVCVNGVWRSCSGS